MRTVGREARRTLSGRPFRAWSLAVPISSVAKAKPGGLFSRWVRKAAPHDEPSNEAKRSAAKKLLWLRHSCHQCGLLWLYLTLRVVCWWCLRGQTFKPPLAAMTSWFVPIIVLIIGYASAEVYLPTSAGACQQPPGLLFCEINYPAYLCAFDNEANL